MYARVIVAAMLFGIGCGSTPSERSTSAPPPVPACELAGDYRLRDVAPATENVLWFRFHVDPSGTTGTLASETARMFDALPVLTAIPDRATCKLAVTARAADGTDSVTFALEIDPQTGKVAGSSNKASSVFGARDIGPPKSPAPCFVPGVYRIDFEPQTACPDEPESTIIRVEPLVDAIEIQLVESEPPYGWIGGNQTATRQGCDVTLTLDALSHGYQLDATLTFAPDSFTGTATKLLAPGRHGNGGTWGGRKDCSSTNAKVSGVRIAP